MTLVDVLGVIGFLLNVWGNLLLTRRSRNGWWVRISSNVLWLLHSAMLRDVSVPVALNALTFLGINVYGLWKWRSSQEQETERTVLRFTVDTLVPSENCMLCGQLPVAHSGEDRRCPAAETTK